MALSTILIATSVALSVASTAYGLVAQRASRKSLKNKDLGTLQITQANEGMPIPLVYGKVRIAGNVVYYGNLQCKNKSIGGKGGGGGGNDQIYTYVDVHQILCYGNATILNIYKDDEPYTPDATVIENSTALDYAPYCSQFKKLTHVFFRHWNLGANNQTVPILQFELERDLSHIPSWANNDNLGQLKGANPAAIVYELLSLCGVQDSEFDQKSFTDAAALWAIYNWGLNFVLSEVKDVQEVIKEILEHCPGILYKNNANKFVLRAYNNQESVELNVDYRDVLNINMQREALANVNTDFVATYTHSNYTERTFRVVNENMYRQIGQKTKTVDYKYFNEYAIQRRMNWLLQTESYPLIKGTIDLPLYYVDAIYPGTIFALEYPDWSMGTRIYRTLKVSKKFDELSISVEFEECPVNLQDSYAQIGANIISLEPSKMAATAQNKHAVTYIKTQNWQSDSLLLLCQMPSTTHRSFDCWWSLDGESYQFGGNFTRFCECGELLAEYPVTGDIDDDVGIVFESDILYPSYLTNLSRAELFTTHRFAVIGDELVKFQTCESLGGNQYKLLGVLRYNKQTHAVNDKIYIGYADNCIMTGVPQSANPIYLKYLPKTWWDSITDDAAIQINYSIIPQKVSRMIATRSGSTVAIEIIPNTQTFIYDQNEDNTIDYGQPYPVIGQLIVSKNEGDYVVVDTAYTIDDANAFSLTAKHLLNGMESAGVTVSVGTDDGIYIGV